MTLFRPCIDLHQGHVKQIVGGTLGAAESGPQVNFVSSRGPTYYAEMYRDDGLTGGHVIRLGSGNEEASLEALRAWPNGLQLGGGIGADNARLWLDQGASKVIVTSWLFDGGQLSDARLARLSAVAAPREIVIDLSCRRRDGAWWVATNHWQTITETPVNARTLERLAPYCSEFLVHAADVEGLCQGIDEALVQLLAQASPLPCTYAGGGRDVHDLDRVEELSHGRVDLTFGSALDVFGGSLVRYADCVAFNKSRGQ